MVAGAPVALPALGGVRGSLARQADAALQANSTALRARRRIEQAAAEWAGQNRSAARLWEGGQLAAALTETGVALGRRRARRGSPERVGLSEGAREFLRAGVRRDRRRRARSTAVLSVLLVAALVAAGLATVQRQAADQGQRLAVARLLTRHEAEAALGRDPRTALRLAEAAQQLSPGAETGSALAQLVRDTRYAGTLDGHTNTLSALAYTPDGGTLATADWDHTVLLWDLSGGRPRRLGEPLRHDSGVTALVFTPDGRTLVTSTASNDSPPVTALLTRWDVSNPARPYRSGEPATGPEFGAGSLAATPDGRTVAAGNDDGVQLWDLSDPGRLAPLGGVQGSGLLLQRVGMSTVRLAPDGAGWPWHGERIRLWDLSDPRRRRARPPAGPAGRGGHGVRTGVQTRWARARRRRRRRRRHRPPRCCGPGCPGGPPPFGPPQLPAGRTWSALAFAADGAGWP